MSLTIILPSFNDISELDNGLSFLKNNLKSIDFQLIVVNDGGCESALYQALSLKYGFHLIQLKSNRGKGAAIQAGVQATTTNHLIYCDSDVPYMIEDIENIYRCLLSEGYDVVCGTRLFNQSYKNNTSLLRYALSRLFNLISCYLFPLDGTDNQCGLKGFKTIIANSLFEDLVVQRYAFDAEILYKAFLNNIKIHSVPVSIRNMTPSSIRLYKDGFQMLYDLLRIKLHYQKQESLKR